MTQSRKQQKAMFAKEKFPTPRATIAVVQKDEKGKVFQVNVNGRGVHFPTSSRKVAEQQLKDVKESIQSHKKAGTLQDVNSFRPSGEK